ncbi:MAG: HAD-IA family hydrolase [Akkermansiaceae bacterium]|nr:HAD-IA family hydrolase [Akkermansiaceae bacterium]
MDFLFDIGNVIVNVDFIPSLKRLIPNECGDPDQRLELILERKDEFEAGRIMPDEYFPWAAKVLGHSGPLKNFMNAWIDIFSPNLPMWTCIGELQEQGHRLILFSNINDPHKQHLMEHYPVFENFSGGIFSHQTGHIKPESEIYDLAINQYQLNPPQTAYIDDLPANIQGGKRAGFVCHQYDVTNHSAFLKWLEQIL